MGDERLPLYGPPEVAHELARQAEREIEAADPGTRAPKERFEGREIFETFYFMDEKIFLLEYTAGHGDRLRAPRRAGEVDPVDPHAAETPSAGLLRSVCSTTQ